MERLFRTTNSTAFSKACDVFVWAKGDLNEKQEQAVLEPESQLLIACPGSGKTRTLTYKIAHELSLERPRNSFVAAITYTNRAADEIRERVDGLGVSTDRLVIGTIHSFCLEWILKPFRVYEAQLANGFQIIDSYEREELLDSLSKQEKISRYDFDYFATEGGMHVSAASTSNQQAAERVFEKYCSCLTASGCLDFEMILLHAYSILNSNVSVSRLLSNIFSTLLVDEFQDTKSIQYSIIAKIIKAGAGRTKLFMVGDPNQSIFGSLGGFAMDIEKLRHECGIPILARSLHLNYRSSDRLIKFFNNFNVHATEIEGAGKGKSFQSRIAFNQVTGADDVAGEIARLTSHSIEVDKVPPAQVCILAPSWILLASVTRALSASLPQYQFDGPGMVPFYKDVENIWYRFSRIFLTNASPDMYPRRVNWANEAIRGLDDAGVSTAGISAKRLLRACNSIQVEENDGLEYLRLAFEKLEEVLGISTMHYPSLKAHHNAFFEGSRKRIDELRKKGSEFVVSLDFFRKVFRTRSGITMSTIHGVKGAEFDVVIAFGLLEGMVPHFNDPNRIESAKKLLYVIGSRARRHLYLVSESGRRDGRGKPYLATGVLQDCNFDYDTI